ncbi:hypothetical protein [Methylobacterium persicinum]|uniref:Uncharacterized protein n=1 Tax=Methylobacterium persicinum TaxID=374426 RepID=A0ABU0HPA6_9HYPH|nr:hypothetical protein [Methylobacterium persicinum]MDQ0444136.1 hypothetical protein [Methylobacterium persicinum]GJE40772.1 hypothetical protein KHHGKMAE_4869 [Methylobacterium persicinum]
MTIRITEDEDESGGYAFIELGRPLRSPLLSFRRQDTEPRHLGAEGWQPEVAWLAPLAVTERDGGAVARFGPAVVDRIEELVPIEIVAQDGTSFGIVSWPYISPAPAGPGILAGLPNTPATPPHIDGKGAGDAATGRVDAGPSEDVAAPDVPPSEPPPQGKRRGLPLLALLLLACLAIGAGAFILYGDAPWIVIARNDAPAPPAPPPAEPEPPRLTAAELHQRFSQLVQERATPGAFIALGETALSSRQGGAAFRAFEEADPVTNADAAWQLARFYDPGNAEATYREAARPDLVRAAYYYALWRNRSPRHTDALRGLCDANAANDRLRAICRS